MRLMIAQAFCMETFFGCLWEKECQAVSLSQGDRTPVGFKDVEVAAIYWQSTGKVGVTQKR